MRHLCFLRHGMLLMVVMGFAELSQAAKHDNECESAIRMLCKDGNYSDTEVLAEQDCLELLYGCGKYEQLIGRFVGEERGLRADQQYFLGLAYLGEANEQNVKSLECYFNRLAKSLLADFLAKMQSQYRDAASFASNRDMKYVYHGPLPSTEVAVDRVARALYEVTKNASEGALDAERFKGENKVQIEALNMELKRLRSNLSDVDIQRELQRLTVQQTASAIEGQYINAVGEGH